MKYWDMADRAVMLLVGIAAAGFLTTLCVFLIGAARVGEGWAAWVQAIGSVAAIAIAIYLARDSARREGEIRRQAAVSAQTALYQDRKAQVQAACLLAERVCNAMLKGYGSIEHRLNASLAKDKLPIYAVSRGRAAILLIPTHQIPYTIIGMALLNTAIYADRYLNLARKVKKGGRPNGEDEQSLLTTIAYERRRVETLQKEFSYAYINYDGIESLPVNWHVL